MVNEVNEYDSPLMYVLGVASEFGIMEEIKQMEVGRMYSKAKWKELAWGIANDEWDTVSEGNKYLDLICMAMGVPAYSVWWSISDVNRQYLAQCEVMVKLLCHTSRLKDDDITLRRKPCGSGMCKTCDLASPVDVKHIVMQCPTRIECRTQMFDKIQRYEGREKCACAICNSMFLFCSPSVGENGEQGKSAQSNVHLINFRLWVCTG